MAYASSTVLSMHAWAADINEIYIVRGYLGEQFDQLLKKYPMIRFIDNPYYSEANNISSAFLARGLLSNAYVFEADLLLSNPAIIKKYHYTSDFSGHFPTDASGLSPIFSRTV